MGEDGGTVVGIGRGDDREELDLELELACVFVLADIDATDVEGVGSTGALLVGGEEATDEEGVLR